MVMFFRMTNSPATFQTMINNIFQNLIAKGIVVVYLDDILIFTKTEEEHAQAVQRVLQVLKENKLFFHLEKCEFYKQRIEYLGLVISENEVYRSGQSRRSPRMAYSGEQDGRPGFPRLHELPLEVHSGLFCQSLTPL